MHDLPSDASSSGAARFVHVEIPGKEVAPASDLARKLRHSRDCFAASPFERP